MDKLKGAIKDTNILSVGNITSLTNGSATLLSVVNAFNNYSSNSTQFLSSLSVMQNNILVIAQSYANLDSELAGTIDSNIVNNINSIDLSGENDIVSGTNTGENNSPENVITPNQDEEKTEINTSQSTTVTPSTPNKKSNGVKSTILKVVGGIGVAAGAVGGAIGIKKKMDKNNQIDEEENNKNEE